MVKRVVMSMLIALVGASAAHAAASPAGPWDSIAFEMNSWGVPVKSWLVMSDGGGNWIEQVRKENATFQDYSLVVHEVAAGKANFAKLAAILTRLPNPAPDAANCANFITDFPYGTIRLTRGTTTTEIAWNAGCADEPYRALLDVLQEADALVSDWGKAGKVLRTETHSPPPEGQLH